MPTATPVVNVNLKPCDKGCGAVERRVFAHGHATTCAAIPVPIPCRPPSSVPFQVALGECARGCTTQRPGQPHYADCPARPVKVSCYISGSTWEESEVTDWETRAFTFTGGGEWERAGAACRARWALVKALVLNQPIGPAYVHVDGVRTLAIQRDAAYSALADMARAEEAALAAQRALAPHRLQTRGWVHRPKSEDRPSAGFLWRYVELLIEQVSILGVAP